MKTIPNELTKNFGDPECRRQLMKSYGNSKSAYCGSNEYGELVLISIAATSIQVTTYQDNGWVRIDEYDQHGYKTGERFDGRWRSAKRSQEAMTTRNINFEESVKQAADTLNPNYGKRHNDIAFASDICRAVLNNTKLPGDIRNQLISAIQTLDSIARR